MKKNAIIKAVFILAIIYFLMSTYKPPQEPTYPTTIPASEKPRWVTLYSAEAMFRGVDAKYLHETNDIDYSNIVTDDPRLDVENYDNPKDYAKAVVVYVHDTIAYDGTLSESADHCLENTASDILQTKEGICSTMSKLTVALLRKGGLASRMTSGCARPVNCTPIMALGVPAYPEVPITLDYKGRYVFDGTLHTWSEVWLPWPDGWVVIEPLFGVAFEYNCIDYWRLYLEAEVPNEYCYLDSDNPFNDQFVGWCKDWTSESEFPQ